MDKIKFGVKLWSTDSGLIEEAEKLIKDRIFDYVELMVIPGTQIFPFQKIGVPYIIHTTSDKYGLNIADDKKEIYNDNLVKKNIDWTSKLNAKYLIFHPGFGQIGAAKSFLNKMSDSRILVENMPKIGINGEAMVGCTPEEVKELMGNKFGFCLDFNHAIKASGGLNENYKDYVASFLELKPKVAHISGGILKEEKDNHLNIGEGDYDFSFFVDCIKKSKVRYITLETPRVDSHSLREDVENIKKLKRILFF